MRNARFSVPLALVAIVTLAGCRVVSDSRLGHYDWSLGHPRTVVACEPPIQRAPPCRRRCPPADAGLADANTVSVDPPASSELVPLPTRPVFGPRMDGRQAGITVPQSAARQGAEPPAEKIATPPADDVSASTSLKLRRVDLPTVAEQ